MPKLNLIAGQPSSQQLKKINQMQITEEAFTAEEMFQYPILVSDNLLHRDKMKWSLQILKTMKKTYAFKDSMDDHNWREVAYTKGFVFDSQIVKVEDISEPIIKELIKESPDPESDRNIIDSEGYNMVFVWSVIAKSSAYYQNLKYATVNDVSIGGLSKTEYICPLCNIPFTDENCPHYIPDPWLLWLLDIDEDDPSVAPYYIRHGDFQSQEISAVGIGNNPRARIVRKRDLESELFSLFT